MGLYSEKDADKMFMKTAVKKPGALKATAKAEGALNPDGTISKEWEDKKAKGKGKTAVRARLAKTFDKFRPKQ